MQHLLLQAKSVAIAAALMTTVAATAQDVYTITPAPGEVTELSEMNLKINGSWEQVDRTKKFSFTGPEGVEVPKLLSYSLGADDGYGFSFEDDAVITTPGEYTLTIPEGRFGVNGRLCPEAKFTWTIVAESQGDDEVYTVLPAPGKVRRLSEIHMTFSGDWAQGDRTKKFSFSGPEGVDVPALRSYSDGDGYIFYFEDDAVITTPGDYTLTVPEGRFTVNGVDAPEATFVWTIVEGGDDTETFPAYSIMPEQGEYESLAEGFTLWFDTESQIEVSADAVYLDGPAGGYKLLVQAGERIPTVTVIPVDEDGEPIELTDNGEYTLIFSFGAITVGETANDEPLVFKYTVSSGTATGWVGDYTADPADDSTVTSLRNITIDFKTSSVVVSDTAVPADFPYLLDNETLTKVAGATVYAEKKYLYITLDKEVITPGYYILVVPSQLIKVDGANPADDLYLTYEVEGTASDFEYTFTLSPASGENIGAESPITITFAGDNLASVANDIFAWGKSFPYFTNEMGAPNPSLMIAADGNAFTFTHVWPFEVAGEYTLVIPAGYFTLTSTTGEEAKSALIEAVYTIKTTSIDSLATDEAPATTFTLQGVRVNGNTQPSGVYIINGKKTYLKK